MFQILPKTVFKGKLILPLFKSFATLSKTTFGGLSDKDRIFTNLYGDNDPYITGALKRVI